MERALEGLREDFRKDGKAELFEQLRAFLSREPVAGEYERLAAEMKMTVGAVSVAVFRLRQRYGQRVCRETPRTVLRSRMSKMPTVSVPSGKPDFRTSA
jgi:hypothetical protein